MAGSPTLTLNNGVQMPAIGLGVLGRETRELTSGAVQAAIAAGYRLIDTAAAYYNEREVGEGLVACGIPRSDIFVTTKLWMSQYGYDQALRGFDLSLSKLGLDYLDLYLLHWPVPQDFQATLQSWKAQERLLAEGRVRAIGVSNFSAAHLAKLMDASGTVPAVNQVEVQPRFRQSELRAVHERLGIVTQAWSPIGGSLRRVKPGREGGSDPLTDPVITGLAARYGKTPAQIVLRWHVQNGVAAIPKSFDPGRIAENIAVFDFALTAEEMAAIDALDTGKRTGRDPETVTSTSFDVVIED